MAKVRMKYNAEAARLLFYRAPERETPVAAVRALEQRLGQRLPAAVREWVSGCGDLACISGQDHALPLDRWEVRDGHLLLMYENQNCAVWGVRLDGSDDPPVLWALPRSVAEGKLQWQPVAEHFSTFTWARAWSQGEVWDAEQTCLSLAGRFGPREAAYLRARYREGPIVTDWLGTHHHFTDGSTHLWIVGNQWMAGFWNRGPLRKMIREIWWLLGGQVDQIGSATDAAEAMRAELLANPLPYPGPGWQEVFGDDLADRFTNGCWLESPSDPAVPPPRLDELLDHFDEKHRKSFAGGLTALWLERSKQRIFLVTGDHREQGARSGWWLHGDDEGELEQLARFVRRWGELDRTLAAGTDAGNAVLARLRGAMPS
jgi:hypothetical protein